ncbi:MAG: asparagine synthase [Rhodopirellula sp.]|nr:asparagine synthase [Rhodopirellula sp.]HCA49317.1 asparagine synthase [Planctomycetaceae bacterium]|tara:strand:- start:24786 stop:26072 length:1287 start_codon:yes stop_codon:yes gene_type:complete
MDPTENVLLNMSYEDAAERVASGDAEQVAEIDGQFAIMQKRGNIVRMARSIGRPMRYFLAKRAEGPCLIVAERMEQLRAALAEEGLEDQFHPSYTRMVPAHYVVEIALIGCPDPNPVNTRFFTPERNVLGTDLDEIGERYIRQLTEEMDKWLDTVNEDAPLGVLFSGGIDSGAVLIVLRHLLLQRGQAPNRLKAFTLNVAGTSADASQAKQFVDETDMSLFLEVVDVAQEDVNFKETIKVIEDYKPLDVQSATMAHALLKKIRELYPDWIYLIDGDGGDENLKDYPIEDNPELTIVSVLNNLMLYQEGWGVESIKHSLTYSGGQSRGHVRTYAPAATLGFRGFSPFALPSVINVAEGIPFIELTDWDHERLYELKGEIVRRGVEAVTGVTMPIFEKRRFQHGAASEDIFLRSFPDSDQAYRDAFAEIF